MLNLAKAYAYLDYPGRTLECIALCRRILSRDFEDSVGVNVGDELRSRIYRDYEEVSRMYKNKVLEMREFERVFFYLSTEKFYGIKAELEQSKAIHEGRGVLPEALTAISSLVKNLEKDLAAREFEDQYLENELMDHVNSTAMAAIKQISDNANSFKPDSLHEGSQVTGNIANIKPQLAYRDINASETGIHTSTSGPVGSKLGVQSSRSTERFGGSTSGFTSFRNFKHNPHSSSIKIE